jgi:hypothetical protein
VMAVSPKMPPRKHFSVPIETCIVFTMEVSAPGCCGLRKMSASTNCANSNLKVGAGESQIETVPGKIALDQNADMRMAVEKLRKEMEALSAEHAGAFGNGNA